MKINNSAYTIVELIEKLNSKDLIINRDYQRQAGVWPQTAKSYFIDTILEEYPFPKLYFYQVYDKIKKKPVMEVVDGQQRLLAISEFINNELALSKASKHFSGNKFEDLDDEKQDIFRMYSVPVDVILAAEKPELLEMFRRINAYTAPLNQAEKRHVKYQGLFKWFIAEISDRAGGLLANYGILTTKQIIRMGDAELLSELIVILEQGLVSKSEAGINSLYSQYDKQFEFEREYESVLLGFFDFLTEQLYDFRNTLLMKTYVLHSLFAVFAQQKRGIPNGERDLGIAKNNLPITITKEKASRLYALIDAHETKDTEGEYKDYVLSVTSTTTKAAQRKARAKALAEILCM